MDEKELMTIEETEIMEVEQKEGFFKRTRNKICEGVKKAPGKAIVIATAVGAVIGAVIKSAVSGKEENIPNVTDFDDIEEFVDIPEEDVKEL